MDNKIQPEKKQKKIQTLTNSTTLLDACKRLSLQDCEWLDLMIEGESSCELSTILHLSKSTIENHITTIGKKFNLFGREKVRKWLNEKLWRKNSFNSNSYRDAR